jgi:hypothetical protein
MVIATHLLRQGTLDLLVSIVEKDWWASQLVLLNVFHVSYPDTDAVYETHLPVWLHRLWRTFIWSIFHWSI